MVQFNLLPDVKLDYVKTQHTKHLLMSISVVVSIASLVVLALALVTVDVVQKKSLNDLDGDVTKYSAQLKSIPDLDKILTVQNQLSTLTGLHDQKPVTSRLFGYIGQVTPAGVGLDQLSIDFGAHTLTMGGSAPTLGVVNTYTDTLKAATYKIKGGNSAPHAFTNVVLASYDRSDSGATFTINCTFDPAIFNTKNDVTLTVPQTADAGQSSVFEGGN